MLTKQKILVFSDWFLPGFKAGGPIRSLANLVHSLDIDFWIITRITDHHSDEPYKGIVPNTWTQHRPNVQVKYVYEQDITQEFLKKLYEEKDFGHIYFNSLFSPNFTLLPLRVARRLGFAKRCILAPRGMLKPGALSIKPRKKKVFLLVSRYLGWFDSILWHATNEQEANEIRLHYGKAARVCIAPNLASVIPHDGTVARKSSGELTLVCIARISEEKGIREALHFLLDSQLGNGLSCIFYGTQQNSAYLEECKALAAQITGANITFPGEIEPEQLHKALQHSHFFYMTTWGENFGHAIAEALQHGKPVIISNRTPWRNLEAHHAGWDLELAATSFTPVLRACYSMDQEEYTLWSKSARAFGAAQANNPEHLKSYHSLFA